MATIKDPATRGRFFLIIIILIFAVPLATAWLIVDRWRPGGSVHHGQLLDPVHPIHTLAAVTTLDGQPLAESFLQGRWTLAYIAPSTCAEPCKKRLYDMRQIRTALGKEIDRTQTIALFKSLPDQHLMDHLASEHREMTMALISAPAFDALTLPFDSAEPAIFLVDPLTNLVMRYPTGTPPKGILKDLKRLLKYSKIG